jgi:hypothetical protein
MVGGTAGKTKNPPVTIPNVKELHDFKFHDDGLLARKLSGIGNGKLIDFTGAPMANFKVETHYVNKIQNEEKLDNFRSGRSTQLPYKRPGDTEVVKESDSEIEDKENIDSASFQQNGLLHQCPRSPCVSQFIRSDRLDVHLLRGICKILKPTMNMKEHVTTMYINSYGVSFHEHLNKKQKEAKSMVMHLQELPDAEVPSDLEMEDSPLASASATFNDLFPKGFAIHQPKKKSRFTEDQLLYIKERFTQGRSKAAKKAQPIDVESQMREETVEGENGVTRARFPPNLWLSEAQIRNLFSKMALDIRVGDILNEQENPTEDNFHAEAQVAVNEEQENSFIAQNESEAVFQVKQLAQKETEEDVTEHPMMV